MEHFRCLIAMIVQMFSVGGLLTNCYVVGCEETKEAIIIDPGFDNVLEGNMIFQFIQEKNLRPRLILNTHGHPDHTCGNGIAKEKFQTDILIHEQDAHMLGEFGKRIGEFFGFASSSPPPDKLLRDGDSVMFGTIALKVLHTPGHSPGSISLVGENAVFTGDALFARSVGRVDLPQSSEKDMHISLGKLASLPESFTVYSGHGPVTTIGEEKKNNPFLKRL